MPDEQQNIPQEEQKKPLQQAQEDSGKAAADLDKVESIVSRMKKRYESEGVESGEVSGRLSELRGIIAEGKQKSLDVQRVENLTEFRNPVVRGLGKIFLAFKSIFNPLSKLLSQLSVVKSLGFYLYSANMRYSVNQYLALATVGAVLVGAILAVLMGFVGAAFLRLAPSLNLLAALGLGFVAFFYTVIIFLMMPKSKASARAEALNVELPFALRHMGTELRAGIGLYKTLQTIASADYGVLSEEFARTINEIEEGTDTKDALKNFSLRTQSKPLKNALNHIVRALKTGGNLSEIMADIAEDVAFDLHQKMRDFAEKMNFFGVIFIFVTIVMPVYVAILGAIANVPLGLPTLPLDPVTITLFFALLMPAILLGMIYFMKKMQPSV